jgi:transcriptional regulator with XRE-family HTH domain
MTQEHLAAEAGIGRITLVRIENAEQSPRYETLMAIARALRRPLAELLLGQSASDQRATFSNGQAEPGSAQRDDT